jgi:hypothetical protein
VLAKFAPSYEDDVSLARVGILLLQKEELFDSVLAESRDLDYASNWPGEALLDDDVLLPSHLRSRPGQRSPTR